MSRCKLLKVPRACVFVCVIVNLFVWLSFYFRVVFVCVCFV